MTSAEPTPTAAAVVLASGAGTRVGADLNKVYLRVAGRCVVSWSLAAFRQVPHIGVLLLVGRPRDAELIAGVLADEVDAEVEVIDGGASRQESELRALRHLAGRIAAGRIDTVLLHDGARPLVSPDLITEVLRTAREHGGAIPGLPTEDVVAVNADGTLVTGPGPRGAVRAQTPQAFRAEPLLAAYERAASEGFSGTDTASCMERYSDVPVHWVRGERENLKVTYPHDLRVAEQVLRGSGPATDPAR
ncbi:IspD/TarI family cytidylyltransferase [Amycolatopsis cihanbeyliensis]|uniref:2-C-methyl-D-erythritol 4-phosphate cytidylyltransferase n=1 Tax=Amycolatopsis cihanbeyliensis TaxID=1128664 RepID=A0A542DGH9_AMYCI|nr:IspD/TarI family cytidylyltransferase [Amycolatopsis cihanbeyliensis]TQJ02160.1 2-C-methyl-D-erythritol 4-phosphate cytidylyltransferase [Amycolatopsis cihanbeyliensis]